LLLEIITRNGVELLALIGWSWTAGFVLGSLFRRTATVTAMLLGLVVFGATLGTSTTGRANPYNSVAFSMTFYGLMLPALVS
jgi:hypothetical protein